ncbi:FecR family protein [Chitinophaga filiformis]|uniref:Ferric-dicitrate binding protein FerR, regulates iron transport through sigma-19 n=1 Tax=Chitinophaga filiformis TaxID=104663 RepID=A0A1G8DIW1_CHIFI|nr:FecR domain-containing protein [Chitinophaga filiformis]SDH57607.1 ferric-dicitrate binding protein FerR, regulates iron transport through sigma-19 [Chitinophaga filiformis]
METDKLKRIFRQYLLGQTGEKEAGAIDNWYQSFDSEFVTPLSPEEEESVRLEIWQRIYPELGKKKVHYLRRSLAAAAAVLLLLAGGLTYYLVNKSNPAYTEVTTAVGQRKTIQLADGSQLTLNAGSIVRIPKDMRKERRLNIVDGEVFFDVKGEPSVPFIVESGPLTTTVLGTSFNVTAYKEVNRMSVAVTDGKVSVQRTGSTAAVLVKDQALTYDRAKNNTTIDAIDKSLLGWRQGSMVLNDASFEDMVVLMQKNFGIMLTTSQLRVRQTRYTTELSTDMDPVKAAEVLAAIHNLKIEVTGHVVTLYE